MEPLKTNRYLLSWLCLYPNDGYTSSSMVFAKRVFAVQSFVVNFTGFWGSVIFACNNFQSDFERALVGVLQMSGLFHVIYFQIFGRFLRPKIVSTIEQISKFHHFRKFVKILKSFSQYLFKRILFVFCNINDDGEKDRKNPAMYEFLAEANKESERFTVLHLKILLSIKSVAASILFLKIFIFCVFFGMDRYENTSYQMAYVIFLT